MQRLLSFLLLLGISASSVFAQVPKQIVVEHFTNTVCGICAFRNPGFYTNLSGQADAIHITYHPSAPYASCVLNQHNVSENDGRTNYYNTYGSTPDFFFQGEFVSGDVSISSVFDPYEGEMSPAGMKVIQTRIGTDSIRIRVVVSTEATHSLTNLRLFVALAEDTIFYNAPNGENEHYNVFRKALTNVEGNPVTLPAATGDSIVFEAQVAADPEWDFDRMSSMVILQEEGSKAVVQASATTEFRDDEPINPPAGFGDLDASTIAVYPNPVADVVFVELSTPGQFRYEVFNHMGQLMMTGDVEPTGKVDLQLLPAGTYLMTVSGTQGSRSIQMVKE